MVEQNHAHSDWTLEEIISIAKQAKERTIIHLKGFETFIQKAEEKDLLKENQFV